MTEALIQAIEDEREKCQQRGYVWIPGRVIQQGEHVKQLWERMLMDRAEMNEYFNQRG